MLSDGASTSSELGADFPVTGYHHRAFFNTEASQIEMHLVADHGHTVSMGDAGVTFDMAAGESIRTEISRKFRRGQVEDLVSDSGLTIQNWHTDPDELFAVALLSRAIHAG